MAGENHAETIRSCFDAYRTKDRGAIERLLSDDFTFTSPYDDRIDRAAYFERCWPNSGLIEKHIIEKLFVEGDEAFVLYRCITRDGKKFRNTEFFTLSGAQITSVNVYFGATYREGIFVKG